MISTLDFLYIVLGVGMIPIFVLLSMVLWRVFKMMDRIESLLTTAEQVIEFSRNIDKVPGIIAQKLISGFHSFFK